MKALLLAATLIFVFSTRGLAQMDDSEKAFELEEETVQIHDAEGEQKAAAQEAKRAEKLEHERKQQLTKLRSEKAHALQKAQAAVTSAKVRIDVAEKKQKAYQLEIDHLNKEITQSQTQAAQAEAKARVAVSAAEQGKDMIAKERAQLSDLQNRKQRALSDTSRANDDLRRMRIDYARLKMETQELEGHLRLIEQSAARSQAERDRMQRDIAAMKSRKEAASDAIRQRNGSP